MKNSKIIKQLSWTQRFAALICFLFLFCIALDLFTEGFRFNPRFRWIYQYGQLISIVLFYGTFLASLINSVLISGEGANWTDQFSANIVLGIVICCLVFWGVIGCDYAVTFLVINIELVYHIFCYRAIVSRVRISWCNQYIINNLPPF